MWQLVGTADKDLKSVTTRRQAQKPVTPIRSCSSVATFLQLTHLEKPIFIVQAIKRIIRRQR